MNIRSILSLICIIGSLLLVSSCATGSAIVTGKTRAPIDPKIIKIYLDAPDDYEVIGLVIASSDSGWNDQDEINLALEELKRQAAKLGANGILLDKVDKSTSGYLVNTGGSSVYAIPISEHTVSGKAIYVN